jgi:hypothetical protein
VVLSSIEFSFLVLNTPNPTKDLPATNSKVVLAQKCRPTENPRVFHQRLSNTSCCTSGKSPFFPLNISFFHLLHSTDRNAVLVDKKEAML